MGSRYGASRGSFLPVLNRIVQITKGPVLELGVGYNSSPYLYWACYPSRRLVSYENNPEFYKQFAWPAHFHEIHLITDWNAIDISEPWSVAFVDHSPNADRAVSMTRLTHADFVVVHDTEDRNDHFYHTSEVSHLYKYKWRWEKPNPQTSVFSNKFDPNVIFIENPLGA